MPELIAITVALVLLAVATPIARTTPLLPPLNITRPLSRWERRHTCWDAQRATERATTEAHCRADTREARA